MAREVVIKKWGNSMGVLLPKKLIEKENLKENDKVFIEIVKKADLSDIFGTIKNRKITGQEFKNIVKEGWLK